jgi:hypothetical protein
MESGRERPHALGKSDDNHDRAARFTQSRKSKLSRSPLANREIPRHALPMNLFAESSRVFGASG